MPCSKKWKDMAVAQQYRRFLREILIDYLVTYPPCPLPFIIPKGRGEKLGEKQDLMGGRVGTRHIRGVG